MGTKVQELLTEVLELWSRMKRSDMDEAGDDADRFQMTFYEFTDAVREWVDTLSERPSDSEEARQHKDFVPLFDALPEPLQIPFETELDAILDDVHREADSSEQ